MTITYQWQRSTPGSGVWTDIAGATGIAYNVEDADATYLLRVVETDTNIVGQDSEPSTATTPSAVEEQGTGFLGTMARGKQNHVYVETGRGILIRVVRGRKIPVNKTGRGVLTRVGSGYRSGGTLLYLWDSLGNLHMRPGKNILDDLT